MWRRRPSTSHVRFSGDDRIEALSVLRVHPTSEDKTIRVVLQGESGPIDVLLREQMSETSAVQTRRDGSRSSTCIRAGVDHDGVSAARVVLDANESCRGGYLHGMPLG